MSPRPYVGALLVTVAYVVLYYLLVANQLRVKRRLKREHQARGEKFDRYFNTDREMLAADRLVGNMLEHMPPFLVLLWLDAVFVGPRDATFGGAAYVGCRVVYPFLMGGRLGRGVPTRILFATVVGYAVLTDFGVRLYVVVATLS